MVLELTLLAVVLVAVGYTGLQYYNRSHASPTAAVTQPSSGGTTTSNSVAAGAGGSTTVPTLPTPKMASTPAGISGGVNTVAEALSTGEMSVDNNFTANDQSSAGSDSSAATNVGGALNASNF